MIYIEGNIGVGKTTLLNALIKYNLHVITEPVEKWVDILELYYGNKQKYAFLFQMKILLSWIDKIMLIDNSNVYFTERSLLSGKEIFFYQTCKENLVNEDNIKEYNDCFDQLTSIDFIKKIIKPTAYIYLKAPPEICYQRIKKRNRQGEEHITLEYLQTLDLHHQVWLKKQMEKGVKVLEIDNSEELCVDKMYQKILSLLI